MDRRPADPGHRLGLPHRRAAPRLPDADRLLTATTPRAPAALALVGWSGSGKTTLLTAILPHLAATGLIVSTLKHAHHSVEPDTPGKDSHRHRLAGAAEVMLATRERYALFREYRSGEDEPDLATLIARMAPADLYLAEGFKSAAVAKIEVHRPALGKRPLWPDLPGIVAVAADAAIDCPLPILDLADPAAASRFIAAKLQTGDLRLPKKDGAALETGGEAGHNHGRS